MKKIVFLFLLSLIASFTNVGASTTFKEDTYTITITSYRNDYGKIAQHIEKLGTNPFVFDLDKEEQNVFLEGVKEINGEHVFYGALNSGSEEDRVFDAYVLLVKESGEHLDEFSFDCGHDERILNVFMIDELILFQVWSNDEYNRGQLQFFTELRTYDYEYNLIDSVRYEEYYYHTHAENDYYFFSTNPNTNVGMVNSDLEIFYGQDSLKIETGTIYTNKVDIPIINDATLNGIEVKNGVSISYPGNYSLEYNGFTYRFIVDVDIQGVESGGVYDEEITPIITSGDITLNGEKFISGTTIKEPGRYKLTVTGESGYIKSVEFVISSNVDGVLNNQTYTDDVTIDFDGEGYLNNVHMSSPILVSEPGEYTLKIQGANDYFESYYFTVEEEIDETSVIQFIQTYDIVLFVVVMGGGYFVLRKKK
jgi:hypothetical protein